jgi:hypothetical protein
MNNLAVVRRRGVEVVAVYLCIDDIKQGALLAVASIAVYQWLQNGLVVVTTAAAFVCRFVGGGDGVCVCVPCWLQAEMMYRSAESAEVSDMMSAAATRKWA